MDVSALVTPPTSTSVFALEIARNYLSAALLNHSIRSYAWAVDYAAHHEIAFDPEILYVAAVLHDIGLTKEFDSHTMPFESAGGNIAWVFGAGAGWSVQRRARTSQAIVDHMRGEAAAALGPEGFLLEVSTSLDISGRAASDWEPSLISEVLAEYPRLDLASEFVTCFEEQAQRKPTSAAARAVASGIAARLAANPLETAG